MLPQDITRAAVRVLASQGLARWNLAAVADEADCAKGLVHYHHGTKARLLTAMAQEVAAERLEARLEALGRPGTAAVDALWEVLESGVSSGMTQAWLGLLSLPDPAARRHFQPSAPALDRLARAVRGALGADRFVTADALAMHAALDGFEIALHRGDDPDRTREAYHRSWLGVLERA